MNCPNCKSNNIIKLDDFYDYQCGDCSCKFTLKPLSPKFNCDRCKCETTSQNYIDNMLSAVCDNCYKDYKEFLEEFLNS